MKKHRRKIALAVALALLFGSAAASAANYAAGKGLAPSFSGASDAFDLASSGVTKAANWLITRARSSVGSAFSYAPAAPTRPPEVANPSSELPMYTRGPLTPIDVDPHWARSAPSALNTPDRVHSPSFDDEANRVPGVNSVDFGSPSIPSLAGSGGGGNRTPTLSTSTTDIKAPVPELPPYALFAAGLGLLTAITRRRKA